MAREGSLREPETGWRLPGTNNFGRDFPGVLPRRLHLECDGMIYRHRLPGRLSTDFFLFFPPPPCSDRGGRFANLGRYLLWPDVGGLSIVEVPVRAMRAVITLVIGRLLLEFASGGRRAS